MHKGPWKRTQQAPTTPNIVAYCWPTMLRPFALAKSVTGFKLCSTSASIVVVPCKRTQQVATLLGTTMPGVVSQQCWVRLNGLKGLLESFLLCFYFIVHPEGS